MAIDLEKYKIKATTPSVDLSKYKLPEPTPQAPEKKGIFGRLMGLPSTLKSEVETQSKATAQSLGEIGLARKEGQDYGSTFLQYAGSAVRAGVVDPVVSIAKTGASLLTEKQKERGAKMLGDLAQPLVAGVRKAGDVISDIPAVQKFSETPEASTLERNYEALFNLAAILPVGEAKPILKASGLGKAQPVIHDVAWKLSDEVSDLSKAVFSKSEQQLEKSIVKQFEKGVKPLLPGKTTPTQVTKYKTSVVDAVKTINENKNSLKFVTTEGEVISGQTPTSLQQFADSVEQTKKIIFTQYDALAQQSGKAGNVIDLTKVATELDTVINSKSLAISNPQAIVYAQKAKDNLLRFGSIDTATTQDVVQQMNAKLQAYYRNPTPEGAGNSVIDAAIANSLRKEADTFITRLTGTGYGALKGQYGSLKAIEKDIIKANLRNARKNVKGLIDYTDIFTGADILLGIATLNPAHIASGVFMRTLKEYYKYINDPNNIVKGMFKDVTKLSEKVSPTSAIIKNPLGDMGLSIKDVSGEVNQSFLGKPNSSLQKTPQIKTPTTEINAISKPTTKATGMSSITGTKSQPTDLIQEAKKYKSADEFLKSIKKPDNIEEKIKGLSEFQKLNPVSAERDLFFMRKMDEFEKLFENKEKLLRKKYPTSADKFNELNKTKFDDLNILYDLETEYGKTHPLRKKFVKFAKEYKPKVSLDIKNKLNSTELELTNKISKIWDLNKITTHGKTYNSGIYFFSEKNELLKEMVDFYQKNKNSIKNIKLYEKPFEPYTESSILYIDVLDRQISFHQSEFPFLPNYSKKWINVSFDVNPLSMSKIDYIQYVGLDNFSKSVNKKFLIETKSQLKEIYNKAKGETSLIQEAKKFDSGDEFLKFVETNPPTTLKEFDNIMQISVNKHFQFFKNFAEEIKLRKLKTKIPEFQKQVLDDVNFNLTSADKSIIKKLNEAQRQSDLPKLLDDTFYKRFPDVLKNFHAQDKINKIKKEIGYGTTPYTTKTELINEVAGIIEKNKNVNIKGFLSYDGVAYFEIGKNQVSFHVRDLSLYKNIVKLENHKPISFNKMFDVREKLEVLNEFAKSGKTKSQLKEIYNKANKPLGDLIK